MTISAGCSDGAVDEYDLFTRKAKEAALSQGLYSVLESPWDLRRKRMKYIIVEDFSGQEIPFIFPRRVDHTDMREQLPYTKVVSAGFVELGENGFVCSGGNNELEVHAREEKDAAVIAEALRKR